MNGTRLLTTSQTVGPFFHDCLLRPDARRPVLVTPETTGERIRVAGVVRDGDGKGIPDAMIELWQADSQGQYARPGLATSDGAFLGFGRTGTDEFGNYWFETIKPGAVPFDATRHQAPHISVGVFGRGLLNHLYTRLYFADDPATAEDPILAMVPAERRDTLIATRDAGSGPATYRFDIILQGGRETVFFDFGAATR